MTESDTEQAESPGGPLALNLEAMSKVDPRLALRLADVQPLALVPSRSGPPTAQQTGDDGKPIYLHSRYDPVAEARKFAEGFDPEDRFVFFMHGLGLGYHLDPIFAKLADQALVVAVEPDLPTIAAALATTELAVYIATGRLRFLTTCEKNDVHRLLEPVSSHMMLGTQVVMTPTSERVAGEFHRRAVTEIADYCEYVRTQLTTTLMISSRTCRNVLANMPVYVGCPPIDMLRQRFAGHPAIVVSAGPSLRKNVDLLHEAKAGAVIIAVQTTFKPLLARGIVPDFVTSLDYSPICKRFFDHLDDFHGVHMVAEPKAHYEVLDIYDGPISLLGNRFAADLLGPMHGTRDGLRAGSTVAHLAFYLAEYIGADPIIFIGQDLGFSDGMYYAPGAAIHDEWRPELGRFRTLESKEWERIVRRRTMLREIKDVHGRNMYTERLFFTYLQQFERDFQISKSRVIDATEGGAAKQYTEVMTLREALDAHATRPIPDSLRAYQRDRSSWFDPARLPAAREALAARLTELRNFQDPVRETRKLLGRMERLLGKNVEKFNRLTGKVDKLRAKVMRMEHVLRLVGLVDQSVEWFRFAHDRRSDVNKKSGWDRAESQLKRDIPLCDKLLDGAGKFEDILTHGLERMDEAIRKHPGAKP